MQVRRRDILLSLVFRPVFARVEVCGVRFEQVGKGGTYRYLRVHGDETAAAEALRRHMQTHPGVGLIITNTRRNVNCAGLSIDPNRWFSREGARQNLRRLNPQATIASIDALLARLDRERPRLLEAVQPAPGGLLIAVHNNGPGYSVEDEAPISERVHLPARQDPHEFFLCSSEADFDALTAGPYNAVLQRNPPPPDDGSLSRYAARHGWRYVNLEVAHGRVDKQVEMLAGLVTALPERRSPA
jgi:hypothetical protein